jgi:hypothetical protein
MQTINLGLHDLVNDDYKTKDRNRAIMRQLTGFIVRKIASFDGNTIWIFLRTKNYLPVV